VWEQRAKQVESRENGEQRGAIRVHGKFGKIENVCRAEEDRKAGNVESHHPWKVSQNLTDPLSRNSAFVEHLTAFGDHYNILKEFTPPFFLK
jgi:hypothetical protein